MMPEKLDKKRLENQLEFLSLTRNGKHIDAEKRGNFPQLSEPTIVSDSIKECADAINKTNQKPINSPCSLDYRWLILQKFLMRK